MVGFQNSIATSETCEDTTLKGFLCGCNRRYNVFAFQSSWTISFSNITAFIRDVKVPHGTQFREPLRTLGGILIPPPERFVKVENQLDPWGFFSNDWMDSILNVDGAATSLQKLEHILETGYAQKASIALLRSCTSVNLVLCKPKVEFVKSYKHMYHLTRLVSQPI
ncbi:hypothetical protein R1sor_005311 [Riccia sorocarpa]|uniref:Uncharacterized protein n=1 Tax=Riccia sorocarpa TaxID=122646 RepID=A0ABD3HN06_9MARC